MPLECIEAFTRGDVPQLDVAISRAAEKRSGRHLAYTQHPA